SSRAVRIETSPAPFVLENRATYAFRPEPMQEISRSKRSPCLSAPPILNHLFAPAASLPGVGPKTATLLEKLLAHDAGQVRVLDLDSGMNFAAPVDEGRALISPFLARARSRRRLGP